jgi:acyl-homoserine-lactone acylase
MKILGILCLLGAAASAAQYEARIRRTTYGIPHIEAKDFGSLGFGEGYAQAEDHLCSIADQVVKARGERARYFGAGKDNEHLYSDATVKALDLTGTAARDLARSSREFRDWVTGFVAGYNDYLRKTGRDKVPGWCRGADWVFPITTTDLSAYHRSLALTLHQYSALIGAAKPPEAGGATSGGRPEPQPEFPEVDLGASNGWALGRDKTESGRGMLLANPHYPWVGSNRFWEKHLTIPGKLDVYGVSLLGSPGIAIGFNRHVGWTHTVSAGKRVTFYTLELVPGRPTVYRYGSGERSLTPQPVAVEVKQPGGSVRTVNHTVWFSHYGPVLAWPGVGWTAQRTLAVRDANWENAGTGRQHLAMSQARNMKELQAAHAKFQGMTWINTIATSAEGLAWYADTAATPRLSAAAIEEWRRRRESDALVKRFYEQGGSVLLDGANPANEWTSERTARPGVVPFSETPKLERTDYVFNANDSFWLANSSTFLDGGYSPLHGEQRTPRSLRTRNNALTLSGRSPDRPAGADGRFNLDELGDAILSNRAYAAELIKDELVSRCRAKPQIAGYDLTKACATLAQWNGRNDLDSRGAVLFKEFMGRYEPADLRRKGKLWAVDFDPQDPVNTPHTLAPGDLALENLAAAAKLLESRGLAVDVPLGEVQYADKAGRRIPIHGGDGAYDGLMNMQGNSRNTTTLEPMEYPAPVRGSRFLTEKGYPVVHGSSFLMALEYTDQGPRAKAFLTYSQSGDPQSPHFTDQTELFSKKQWRPILFREDQIASAIEREYRVRGGR